MKMSVTKAVSVVFMILSFARASEIQRSAIGIGENVDGISQQMKNKSFDIITTPLTWYKALVVCKERHGDLATIRSKEENDLFVESLGTAGFNLTTRSWIWIGGTKLDSSRGYFWMADGSSVTYSNWRPGRPESNESYDCITYGNTIGATWGWINTLCDTVQLPFACEYF